MYFNQSDLTLLDFAQHNLDKRKHNEDQRRRLERDQRRNRKPTWDGGRHNKH